MPTYDNRNERNRAKWTPAQVTIDWIESCLVNDEEASDEEMRLYFLQNELDSETCDRIMAQRNEALMDGMNFRLDITGLNLANSRNGIGKL